MIDGASQVVQRVSISKMMMKKDALNECMLEERKLKTQTRDESKQT